MLDTAQFIVITYFAAMVGVIPPGLVNMTVAKTCVNKGKRSGLRVALGASMVVFFQAMLAILMAKYIFNHPYVQKMILRAGLVVFLIMGVYFFIAARKPNKKVALKKQESTRNLVKGMMIAAVNVFPIPYFVTISAAFHADDFNFSRTTIVLFALAASLGTFTTLYMYVVSFMKIEKHNQSFSKYSNYFMAGLMFILVVITLLRIFY